MRTNNYILTCLCSCLLLSCQDSVEELGAENSNLLGTRSGNEDPFEQLLGMPLNIKLANTVGPATYLSVKQIDGPTSEPNILHPRVTTEDTGNGLQQWILHKITPEEEGVPSFYGYNMYILSMVGQYNIPELKEARWFNLSAESMSKHRSTGHQHNFDFSFVIEPVNNLSNFYYIIYSSSEIFFQGEPDFQIKYWQRLFATGATDGSLIRTSYLEGFDPYYGDELFRWEFTPADIFEIESISYYQMPGDYISLAPDFVSDIIVENKTSLEQSMTANFAQKATIQSKFSETEGFSVTVKTGVGVNLCKIFNGSLDMTTVSSTTSSFENSETKEDSRSYSFPVKVPPFKKVKARVVVQRYNANISYRAVFKGIKTGKRLTLTGKWEGVTASTITYQLIEGENGKVLRSFTGVPTSEIDLTK